MNAACRTKSAAKSPRRRGSCLPVVGLRADAQEAQAGDQVGASGFGGDVAAAFEFFKQRQRAAGPGPAVAGDGPGVGDAAMVVLFHDNTAALSEQVQDPLLRFRDVH